MDRRAAAAAGILGLVLMATGCGGEALNGLIAAEPSDGLRIATGWPRAERARLASEFAAWLRSAEAPAGIDVGAIAWLEAPESGPSPREVGRGGLPPDVLLGGPTSAYARMAAEDRLEPLGEGAPRPFWVVSRSSPVGLSAGTEGADRIALADPRLDPATLAWCLGRTDADGWRAGYSGLLIDYGSCATAVGWRGESARASVSRGRADRTVAVVQSSPFAYVEGAAIPQGSRRVMAARAFLKFLVYAQGGRPGPEFEGAAVAGGSARAEGLAADLLGSTLVDAREELATAVAAVREAGSPAWAVERLTQPPPWPPASIEKLLARGGESGLALVETLMGQVAPEPGLRDWLARSWLRPRRDLDRQVLAEIADAEGGRLAREPRFRAWLRAEWTQWARQRYRWVARLATAGPAAPPPVPSES